MSPADPHAVVGGILVRHGRVLLCHRSAARTWFPNVWDIPGGHIEVGEAPEAALARELREELGIVVAELGLPEFARLQTDDFDLRLWVISAWEGEPSNVAHHEHDKLGWFWVEEIAELPLAHEAYLRLIRDAVHFVGLID